MNGVLLDPRSGKPIDQELHYRSYLDEGRLNALAFDRLPEHIQANLAKSKLHPRGSAPHATKQGFYELLGVDLADGTQILNSTTETIVTADYNFSAADSHIYPGASFDIECYFDVSNVVTTPGNLTLRIRWGGVAGTILATTGAITLSSTARSNYTGTLKAKMTWRTIGSTGSCYCMGIVTLNDVPVAADSAPQSLYTMTSGGANVPAVVSSLDTTTAKALSVTAQFSVSTATTQLTNHLRYLACLN